MWIAQKSEQKCVYLLYWWQFLLPQQHSGYQILLPAKHPTLNQQRKLSAAVTPAPSIELPDRPIPELTQNHPQNRQAGKTSKGEALKIAEAPARGEGEAAPKPSHRYAHPGFACLASTQTRASIQPLPCL